MFLSRNSDALIRPILTNCLGDRQAAFQAVVKLSDAADHPLLDDAAGHNLLQHCIAIPPRGAKGRKDFAET
jgi:hypothetical protein